ncbi:glycosyltransferase family 2 protein [Achromobacter deleyi]|uniref:glycosyltransferase family 2 protein n=1 Tax=Achromobacter deleyi TaxID=1353891 RepID=UPI00149120BA|nr:glycosyltransferase family A protein [Achromobacter deleyi]QVQ25620.1 glycosyltransferase family 2 protein [Achromobacter deleyi]UIP21160.1 glycosyltransferase family 2 protein [Achromobacter deleyi]
MKASVIIPTKNPGGILRSVLQAVCNQKAAFDFDVLVIDSGSTDGTADYVRQFGDKRVRLHEIAPAEFGHGKTRNLGVSLTDGEFAVFITHDALPASDGWLAAMVKPADEDPEVAGVFGRHLAYPDASPFTRRDLERHFAHFEPTPVVRLDDRARYDRDPGYRQFLHFFSDNNALIRRSVWQQFPYPDVDFAEDQIWAETIIKQGWKKAYAHDGVVYHSHDFPPFEYLQRSFDESYALFRLFGYTLVPSLYRLLRSWGGATLLDLRYAWGQGLIWRQPLAVLSMPFRNLMRASGHYLGSRADRLPAGLRRGLSRDRRMMAGMAVSVRAEEKS